MDRIEAMAAFVAVADLRGFAPAARKLKMSPSAITRLVAALEAHLSIRLFNRTTRSVALTDAGTRYLARARAILMGYYATGVDYRALLTLLYAALALMKKAGSLWWLYLWVLWFGFSLFMAHEREILSRVNRAGLLV